MKRGSATPRPFPWLPAILLVVSVVVFWVVPMFERDRPVVIDATPVTAR